MFDSVKKLFNSCLKSCRKGYLNLQCIGDAPYVSVFISGILGFCIGVSKAIISTDFKKTEECREQVLRALWATVEGLCHKNITCINDVVSAAPDRYRGIGPDPVYDQCSSGYAENLRNGIINGTLLGTTMTGVSLLTCYTLVKCKSYRSKRLGKKNSLETYTNSSNSDSDAMAVDTIAAESAKSDSKLDNDLPDLEAQFQVGEQAGSSFDDIEQDPVELSKPKAKT